MSKKTKILIIVIAIIAVLAICVFAYENVNSKKEENETITEENIVEENKANEINDIIEENIVEENIVEENVVNNKVNNESENLTVNLPPPSTTYQSETAYESAGDVGSTNKKEEAINLVKEKWGEDNTVTFSCDSVTADGEYIIAVTSLETATVRNYFRVNLQTKEVIVEY